MLIHPTKMTVKSFDKESRPDLNVNGKVIPKMDGAKT